MNHQSIIAFLKQLQHAHDSAKIKSLLVELDFNNLRTQYIKEELLPEVNRAFEEVLERKDTSFAQVTDQFLLKNDEALEQQYVEKRKAAATQRADLIHILENHNNDDPVPMEDHLFLDYLSGFLVEMDNEIMDQIIKKYPSISEYVNEQKLLLEELQNFQEEDNSKLVVDKVAKKLEKEGFFDEQKNNPENANLNIKITEPKIKQLPPSSTRSRWWAIAATIALLLAGGFYLFNPSKLDNNQIYAKYHQKETKIVIQILDEVGRVGIGNPAHPQKELKRSLQLYEANRYEEAIPELKKYLTQNPNDLDAIFVLALSHIEVSQFPAAQKLLDNIVQRKGKWQQEAIFQLAMIYLKDETTTDKSKALLEKISQQSGSYYQQKALKVLKEF